MAESREVDNSEPRDDGAPRFRRGSDAAVDMNCGYSAGERRWYRRRVTHMGWSIKIGEIGGTAIRIHLTFLLLLLWIWMMHYQIGGTAAALEGVLFIIAIFFCVLLHEFGHIIAARHYGIRTPDVTLLPIGGVARLERMPEEPRQELVVAIAGPLVNVVIAVLLFLYLGGVVQPEHLANLEDPRLNFIARLAATNVFLVVFNAIPAFPMDGGRVLRALLAMRIGYGRATQIAAQIGQGLAFGFGFLGLFYNPLLIFIGIFVYLAAAAEAHQVQVRQVSAGVPVSEAMITEFVTLDEGARLSDAIDALLRTTQHEFPVLDASGRLVGILTRNGMIRGLKEGGPDAAVAGSMHADVPTIRPSAGLDQAFRQMQETGAPAVGVVDSAGVLKGILTPENVAEMVMVWSALPEPAGVGPWFRRGPKRA
jgi:Zn-dependent protease/CBS domain-containing protein